MLAELQAAQKVVGVKQSKKLIRDGAAREVFVARDAEQRILRPIRVLCEELGVPVTEVGSMKELGAAAGIDIGASVVAVCK